MSGGDPLAAARRSVALGPDPAGATFALDRWAAAAGDRAAALLAPAGAHESLAALLALGDAPARALVRDPGALPFAHAGPVRPPADEVERRLRAAFGEAGDGEALRRARRREWLRILRADAVGGANLEAVAGALSDLAEAVLRTVLDRELRAAAERDGPPYHRDGTPADLACVALGKLGGGELNYCSDVDLLFVHSGEGACRPTRDEEGRSVHEHFTQVAVAAVRVLSEPTPEGRMYLVDLRLRPRGGAGSVVPRTASAVHYYRSVGRGWERQALLKARPVAGHRALGRTFLGELEPWVYGRPLLSAEIGEIRRLKRAIEDSPDAHEGNLKTGRGGIRDVEFVVQFLQLLLGADHPSVRTGSTLEALRRLEAARALSADEARSLDAAYRFLRLAEHRLQSADDLPVHALPRGERDLARLARRMGLGAEDGEALAAFRALHARHAAVARDRLDRLVHGAFAAEEEKARRVADLLLGGEEPPGPAVEEALRPFGFRASDGAFRDLRRMASAGSPWLPRTRTYFASAAPALLSRAASTPDPDRALSLVQRLSERSAGSGLFFRLLTENPDVLGVFCDLGGHSPYLAEILLARPGIMDAFLDALVTAPPDALPPLDDIPLGRIEEVDSPGDALRDLRDLELLRIGTRDLQGHANARQTAAALTRAAETVVRLAAAAVEARLRERDGPPPGRFAVLGLGRLGASEMAYGSDLDLLFLHDGPEGAEDAAARRARALIDLLGGAGERGPLHRVDLRLRPDGSRGSLTASLAGFARYQRERARTWERQALVRARPVGGDPSLGREAMAAVEEALWGSPPPPGIVGEVHAMRARVEEAGTPGSLKTGRGGVQDAEFLVQALLLRHGRRDPSLRGPNTVDALGRLRDGGVLTPPEHEGLVTAYLFLRTVELRLRLSGSASGSVFPSDPGGLDALARRLGYVDTSYAPAGRSLAEEVAYYRDRTRTWYERVMAREGKSTIE